MAGRDAAAPDRGFSYWPPPLDAPESKLIDWANALPTSRGLNIVCTSLGQEPGVFRVGEAPLAPNPNGAVHGGMVATIADQCPGVVSVIGAPRHLMSVTGSLHGQYYRPALPPLTIRSKLIAAGRRPIFVEAEIDDARGRRCESFRATMVVGGNEQTPASQDA
jgi:uncharacterized protein (TIGR00369 family)